MAWIGEVRSGQGNGWFPNRAIDPNTGVSDWSDPAIPSLAECQYSCGQTGWYDGQTVGVNKAVNWDDLMFPLGKMRGLATKDFWRRILYSDRIFIAWLKTAEVRNGLAKLLYDQCIGDTNIPIGADWRAICERGRQVAAASQSDIEDASKSAALVFLGTFFEDVDNDDDFVRRSIFRVLSYTVDTEQCRWSGKQWQGNQTKCWLCNQNITNIYLGGRGPNSGMTPGATRIGLDIDPKAPGGSTTNKTLADHSIHNKECEHCLPYIIGSFILQLSGGDPKISNSYAVKQAQEQQRPVEDIMAENDINIPKALEWQNLEYEWSHKYCNQLKLQGHFLDYDEKTGKFEINYVQVANFSRYLKCSGNYRETPKKGPENKNTELGLAAKSCNRVTGGGTLTELNWKTFTDETDEIQYKNSKRELFSKNIRTSCNPNATNARDASCRMSFVTDSDLPPNVQSDANDYFAKKGVPGYKFMKDSDAILYKMKDIVEKLNEPITHDEKGVVVQTAGLLAMTRARISSFIVAKYLEDIGKQLMDKNSTFNTVWKSLLPPGWDPASAVPKMEEGEMGGLAKQFVDSLACCCQAAIRSTGETPEEVITWADCLVHSSNAAYLSLAQIGALKGEDLVYNFGRVVTRSYNNASILMANPSFVITLLQRIDPEFKKILQAPGYPLTYLPNGEYVAPDNYVTPYQTLVSQIKTLITPKAIYDSMANEAEAIIPGITISVLRPKGGVYRSRWEDVANFIAYNFEKFIINLRLYSSSIYKLDDSVIDILKTEMNPEYQASIYVNGFFTAESQIEYLEDPDILEWLLGQDELITNAFWSQVFARWQEFYGKVGATGGFQTEDEAKTYITNYLDEYVNNEQVSNEWLRLIGVPNEQIPTIKQTFRRQSARLRGLLPEYSGLFGKVKSRGKPKGKPRYKPKSKPRGKSKSKPKSKSSDTNLKNKLKMVGIKVTKMVKGKRVSLTKKELQKRISAFKKLQAKAKKLKVSLKYKSTSGRYKFKSQRRLISDIKKATKKKNTKRKNTKRKNN